MKILLIGGTGTISTDVTKQCIANGWEVYLLNRGIRADIPSGSIHLRGDINDEAHIASLIAPLNFDVVANFINYTPADIMRDIRLFSNKTRQYVFISSASAYQKPLSHPVITESTPLKNPYWAYSRDKIACEDLLIAEYREYGFPMTIVRPSHTYDRRKVPVGLYGNSVWQIIKRIRDEKPILVHGDGSSLWTLTHSEDFAQGFVGLMGNTKAIGEAVHITSDESLSWNQVYTIIAHAIGVEPKLYHVATDFLVAVKPSLSGPLLGDKAHTVIFDNSKIKRLVPGFCAKIRFGTGVRWSLDFLLNTPSAQIDDPEFDQFTDNIIAAQQAARASLS